MDGSSRRQDLHGPLDEVVFVAHSDTSSTPRSAALARFVSTRTVVARIPRSSPASSLE